MSKKRILIVCTGNSCRSQMAEGFMKSFNNELEVFSAGTRPEKQVNPFAVRVMKEKGIDISNYRPKHVDDFTSMPFDYVITVCDHAKESCPIFPGAVKVMHWPFPDPPHSREVSEAVLEEFRNVRDMIIAKFQYFHPS